MIEWKVDCVARESRWEACGGKEGGGVVEVVRRTTTKVGTNRPQQARSWADTFDALYIFEVNIKAA